MCAAKFLLTLSLTMLIGLSLTHSLLAQESPPTVTSETPMTEATKSAIDRGLDYLAGQQSESGSFGTDRLLSGNTGVCGLAGLAFLSQGSTTRDGKYAEQIRGCIRYLELHCQTNGLIDNKNFQSSGPMYGHGFALLFLAEVYGMPETRDLKDNIQSAVDLIVRTQGKRGGWRYQPIRGEEDLSVTVCQLMALRAARNAGFFVPAETVDLAVDYIRTSQNGDGGFSYQLTGPRESGFARSAAAVVGLQSAGIYSGKSVDEAIKYIFASRPSNDELESSYFYYGHYYAVQAVWQMNGQPWEQWYPAICENLIRLQQGDGHWTSRYSPEYSTAMALIILQIPNNILPIFQR